MHIYLNIAFGLIFAYLLGAIPFALIIGKTLYGMDPRQHGSGNLGATNTLRVLGVKASIAVLVLDASKGALAIVVMRLLLKDIPLKANVLETALVLTMFVAVVGHLFSPYIGFKGGKGVATTAGCLFAMQPKVAFILLTLFIIVVALTKYVSLGSITIATCYPFLVLVFYPVAVYVVFAFILAVLIIFMHRTNIARLRAGTESKIAFHRSGDASQEK